MSPNLEIQVRKFLREAASGKYAGYCTDPGVVSYECNKRFTRRHMRAEAAKLLELLLLEERYGDS